MSKCELVRGKIISIAEYRMPKLLSAQELSEIVKIPAERITELAMSGFFPCVLMDGAAPMFLKEPAIKYVKENMMKVQEGKPYQFKLYVREGPAGYESLPEALKLMHGDIRQYSGFPPCIYFLCLNKEILYVGQSVDLANRITSHMSPCGGSKIFDEVFYLEVPRSDLNKIEREFIKKFNPPLNKQNF